MRVIRGYNHKSRTQVRNFSIWRPHNGHSSSRRSTSRPISTPRSMRFFSCGASHATLLGLTEWVLLMISIQKPTLPKLPRLLEYFRPHAGSLLPTSLTRKFDSCHLTRYELATDNRWVSTLQKECPQRVYTRQLLEGPRNPLDAPLAILIKVFPPHTEIEGLGGSPWIVPIVSFPGILGTPCRDIPIESLLFAACQAFMFPAADPGPY